VGHLTTDSREFYEGLFGFRAVGEGERYTAARRRRGVGSRVAKDARLAAPLDGRSWRFAPGLLRRPGWTARGCNRR
jgi:hypothetical protein